MKKTWTRGILVLAMAGATIASCKPSAREPSPTPRLAPATATVTTEPTRTPSPTHTLPAVPSLLHQVRLDALPAQGHNPQAAAALNGLLYVANWATDNVSVIEDGRVVEVIEVGDQPLSVSADASTGLVYVANGGSASVSFISGRELVRTIWLAADPCCLVSSGGRIYVAAQDENLIYVLDGTTGKQLSEVPIGGYLRALALAINETEGLLYASLYSAVEIVDAERLSVVGRLEREVLVTLGADPSTGRFFLSQYDSASGTHYLVGLDALGERELGRVAIGGDPRGMAVDAVRRRIYVANSWSNDVSVIDLDDLSLLATVPVGLRPVFVALDENGRVYVLNSESANVAMLNDDGTAVDGVIPLASTPGDMVVDAPSGRLYVSSSSSNSVLVIQDGRVVADVYTGLHPRDLALSADGTSLAVLNYVGGDLVLVDTSSDAVVQSTLIGRLPRGLAFAPGRAELYASDAVLDSQASRFLRDIQILTSYGEPVKPLAVRVDPVLGRAYFVAFNGVPGSNGGNIVYAYDLYRGGYLVDGRVGGLSMTGLALDVEGERIFSTAGRFGSYELIVDDARSLEKVASLPLPGYPGALAFNPSTKHLFILLLPAGNPGLDPGGELWVLDARGLGTVAKLMMTLGQNDAPVSVYSMATDANLGLVYVSDAWTGLVHLVQDVSLPVPPSPTSTFTPTPWPSLTARPVPTPTTTQPSPVCSLDAAPPFNRLWTTDQSLRTALGCPSGSLEIAELAGQAFERGRMVWRATDRRVFVLWDDGFWQAFADHWQEGMPELSCEASPPVGMQQPKRGFGLVWCDQSGVREGLGWALQEEYGYSGPQQTFERGWVALDATGFIAFVLLDDGTFVQYDLAS